MKMLQEAALDAAFEAQIKKIQIATRALEKLIGDSGPEAFVDSQRNQIRQAKIDFEVLFAAISK